MTNVNKCKIATNYLHEQVHPSDVATMKSIIDFALWVQDHTDSRECSRFKENVRKSYTYTLLCDLPESLF